MKIQVQLLLAVFCLSFSVVQAQDVQPISEQNKAWFNPALISTNNGVSINSQAALNYQPLLNSNIQYFNAKNKLGFLVVNNNVFSQLGNNSQIKASVAKGFRFKGIDVTAAVGFDRFKNQVIDPQLRFNAGVNLKIKQLEIGYAFISSAPNNRLIDGNEPLFINNYIPSKHTFSTSYSINVQQWSLQPSIFYARMGNFIQLQLQTVAVYKNKLVLGLATSQFDPNYNRYSLITGYKTNRFELTLRPQFVLSDASNAPIIYNTGFSYYFGARK